MAQPATAQQGDALLDLRDLHVSFATRAGDVPAVRGVDLKLRAGETLAVVGESGSGKTVSALAVIGLIDPPGRVVRGSVWFDGVELTALPPAGLRAVRRLHVLFKLGRRDFADFQCARVALDQFKRCRLRHSQSFRGACHRHL